MSTWPRSGIAGAAGGRAASAGVFRRAAGNHIGRVRADGRAMAPSALTPTGSHFTGKNCPRLCELALSAYEEPEVPRLIAAEWLRGDGPRQAYRQPDHRPRTPYHAAPTRSKHSRGAGREPMANHHRPSTTLPSTCIAVTSMRNGMASSAPSVDWHSISYLSSVQIDLITPRPR